MLNLTDRARARFPDTEKFKVTSLLIDEITAELKAPRAHPIRIATKFGVPTALVRFVHNEIPQPGSTFTTHSEDGWGRKELRDFIVTRKLAHQEWAEEDKHTIENLRERYDAGEIELAQGRDGNFVIQYAFVRSKKAKRETAWFKLEVE
jgi:hypothetical protein